MARKKAEQVVDAEVVAETTPKRKRASKPTITIEQPAEPVVSQVPAVERMGDDGSFDVATMSDEEKRKYSALAEKLDPKDIGSLTSYGSDLSKAMDGYATEFLKQRFNSSTEIESKTLVDDLLCEIKRIDVGDFEKQNALVRFISKLPVLNHCVMTIDRLKTKYYTMEQSIQEITKKLEAVRLRSLRDNTLLEHQYENNLNYIEQVGHLIIAGKMKSKEIEVEIENLKAESVTYKTMQEIANLQDYKDQLDKRIYDLQVLRVSFINSLPQIKIIEKTNMTQASNIESQIALTIPLWKNNMGLAVALYNQKQGLAVSTKVNETNDELMRTTSEMLKKQAVEVARQAQQAPISIETLKKTIADTVSAIEGIQKVTEEGAAERAKSELELRQLEKEIYEKTANAKKTLGKVVAKELKDVSL